MLSSGSIRVLAILAVILTAASGVWASSEKVIHSFLGGRDGNDPAAGVMFINGDMYGTTSSGGRYYAGTVYELKHSRAGWKEATLYQFTGGDDGARPFGALVADKSGNLYGTTWGGGKYGRGGYGYGTVFELSPKSDGSWQETVLYNFCSLSGCADGAYPYAGLAWDGAGNLYGTTFYPEGTVFQLSPSKTGWMLNTIFNFQGSGAYSPISPVLVDGHSNLYGTASYGTECNLCGVVFELSPSGGSWSFAILYEFTDGADGGAPVGRLIMDGQGNLYGTAASTGTTQCLYQGAGCGVVFELSPGGDSSWTETVLYSFTGSNDGSYANSIVFDGKGNLYGTTERGGTGRCQLGCGTVFGLTQSGGIWKEGLLYSFTGQSGFEPQHGALTTDQSGRLYGTTFLGGKINHGVVYRFVP